MNENDTQRTKRTIATLLLAALAAACGGGGSSPAAPTSVAATPAPLPEVLQQLSGTVPGLAGAILPPVTVSRSGSLEVTVDWTFERNNIDVLLYQGACSVPQITSGQCSAIGSARSTAAKPERIRLSVAAGSYTVAVLNFSEEQESAAVQVVFTAGAAASSPAVALAAAPDVPLQPLR